MLIHIIYIAFFEAEIGFVIHRSGFKLVILDEADAMTHDAQNALRRGKLFLDESRIEDRIDSKTTACLRFIATVP
jgi:hypothetical protein